MRRLLVALLAGGTLASCVDEISERGVEKSMEPTIRSGEFVKVDYGAYESRPPEPGDIVALRPPAGAPDERCGVRPALEQPCPRPTTGLADEYYFKRAVAGPGDSVAIDRRGGAIVNGEALDEPYIRPCARDDRCSLPKAARVPPGHWFVLGDNRPYSSDSRDWGPVPRRGIEGRVKAIERD